MSAILLPELMSEFKLYFKLGNDHILDYVHGYDHILFIIALCCLYMLRDWKSVLILVTAFTVGHSITLALVALHVIEVNTALVEFLIPLTIFITALSNLFKKEDSLHQGRVQLNYLYALFFGLVHGIAFAETLGLESKRIVLRLLAFNLGIEAGQIVIVMIFLVAAFIFVDLFNVNRRDWKMVISSMIAGMAILLMKERMFW